MGVTPLPLAASHDGGDVVITRRHAIDSQVGGHPGYGVRGDGRVPEHHSFADFGLFARVDPISPQKQQTSNEKRLNERAFFSAAGSSRVSSQRIPTLKSM
jgi:hypothetical protein